MRTIPQTINKISRLLRISYDAYIELFFENGCEYLEQNQTGRASEIENLLQAFKCSVSFWQWYCLQSEVIDAVFSSAVKKGHIPATIEAYKLMQLRRQLTIHQRVIDAVIADQNSRKIKTLIKQTV